MQQKGRAWGWCWAAGHPPFPPLPTTTACTAQEEARCNPPAGKMTSCTAQHPPQSSPSHRSVWQCQLHGGPLGGGLTCNLATPQLHSLQLSPRSPCDPWPPMPTPRTPPISPPTTPPSPHTHPTHHHHTHRHTQPTWCMMRCMVEGSLSTMPASPSSRLGSSAWLTPGAPALSASSSMCPVPRTHPAHPRLRKEGRSGGDHRYHARGI